MTGSRRSHNILRFLSLTSIFPLCCWIYLGKASFMWWQKGYWWDFSLTKSLKLPIPGAGKWSSLTTHNNTRLRLFSLDRAISKSLSIIRLRKIIGQPLTNPQLSLIKQLHRNDVHWGWGKSQMVRRTDPKVTDVYYSGCFKWGMLMNWRLFHMYYIHRITIWRIRWYWFNKDWVVTKCFLSYTCYTQSVSLLWIFWCRLRAEAQLKLFPHALQL